MPRPAGTNTARQPAGNSQASTEQLKTHLGIPPLSIGSQSSALCPPQNVPNSLCIGMGAQPLVQSAPSLFLGLQERTPASPAQPLSIHTWIFGIQAVPVTIVNPRGTAGTNKIKSQDTFSFNSPHSSNEERKKRGGGGERTEKKIINVILKMFL